MEILFDNIRYGYFIIRVNKGVSFICDDEGRIVVQRYVEFYVYGVKMRFMGGLDG